MKRIKQVLTLTILGIFMFTSSKGNSQSYKSTDVKPISIKLTAKLHGVISYLETKETYSQSKSSEEFVNFCVAATESKELGNDLRPYLEQIYSFHQQKLSPDQVYDRIDGNLFASTLSKVSVTYKNNKSSFSKTKRLRWFNLIRKIIDLIDDFLQGIE